MRESSGNLNNLSTVSRDNTPDETQINGPKNALSMVQRPQVSRKRMRLPYTIIMTP